MVLKILQLYDKERIKKNFSDIIEIFPDDFEAFKSRDRNPEYLSIIDKIINKKNLLQWFQVNDISYWWFVNPIIGPKFEEITLFIDRLEICLKTHNPTILKLAGYFDKINIINQICKLNNIKLEINQLNYLKFQFVKKIKNLMKKKFYGLITKKKYKNRISLYNKLKPTFKPKKNSIIITSYSLQRKKAFDVVTGETKNEEFFIQPIINELHNKQKPYLCIDLDYSLNGDIKILEERLKSNSDWMPLDVLLYTKRSKNTVRIISSLKKSVNELLKYDLKSKFLYKDISIWNNLKPIFSEIFLEPYLPTFVHLIEKIEEFFKEIQPQVIIQVYEHGPLAKALVIAGKRLGINTIAIQHGIFQEDNYDYMMKHIRNKNNLYGNFIPDTTLAFGEYTKKLLNEFGDYPLDKIKVVGNLSLYNIDNIKNYLSRDQLLKKNKLPDKKIVLFGLTWRLYSAKDSPDYRILRTLYEGLKNEDDTVVLVRPHPGDNITQSTLDKLCPSSNFILSKNNSNLEDIFLCDVIVGYMTTLTLEASLFEKPVLFTDYKKSLFMKNMTKNNMAEFVPLTDLVNTIKSIKKGTLWKISKSEDKKRYLENLFNYGQKVDLSQFLGL